jgi:acetyl-CoA carboxylase beta subunit
MLILIMTNCKNCSTHTHNIEIGESANILAKLRERRYIKTGNRLTYYDTPSFTLIQKEGKRTV